MKRIIPLVFLLTSLLSAQRNPLQTLDSLTQKEWVDNTYNSMSLEEKVGQLLMVMTFTKNGAEEKAKIKKMIEEDHIGGVVFSLGGPVRQARWTNDFQASSKTPLMIAMDAEWGLAMRLDSTYAFPWNMTLGAIQDSSIIEKVGKQIGKHCKRLGVHINFAPVLDININPRNPIIGNRSFGENRENVVRSAAAFLRGMSSEGILSSAKHFPGHGDTATDSHKSLPFLDFTKQRLDSVELYPYKELLDQGLSSVMVAHLNIPAYEQKKGLPSSLSKTIISDLLKKEMGYEGLVFTDALNMKAVSEFAPDGEVELSAFLAGNDILLIPVDVKNAKKKIVEAYEKGIVSEERLAESVKKILMAKYKVGLNKISPIDESNLYEDLNGIENELVYESAIENAITLVKNRFSMVPIRNLDNKKIAYVKLGEADNKTFVNSLKRYGEVVEITAKDIAGYKAKLKDFNLVILGLHKSNQNPWKKHDLTKTELFWLQEIAKMRSSNSILVSFTNPYALLDVTEYSNLDAIVLGYQNSDLAMKKAAELLFGAIGAKGKLPVSIWDKFPVNTGEETKAIGRLGFTLPERVGMSSIQLAQVDSLVIRGIDSLMFPGAQIVVSRMGKVIYNKNFGKATYHKNDSIKEDHIYDLASLTKILSTLPMLMKMEEEGSLKLNQTFEELIPEYSNTELKDVTVLKSLSHYGRLPAWIPFYLNTLSEERKPSNEFYRSRPEDGFEIKVTDKLYLTNAYKDSIYNRIGRQSLKSNRYRYSDVGYYVFKKYIEEYYGSSLDVLLNKFLLKSLGANNTSFNPVDKFEKERIVPSEEDNYFRHQTIHGYVHDMGAAMQGGVGGHAGLFSNALDVAKIMQMYLQGGYYGGIRYLDTRTVEKFNKCYFCHKNVRRGVGFDKPQLEDSGPTCGCVSRKSFGHSGFTGTYTWADPEEEIVYVFLSNRTYPTSSNRTLVKSGLRTRIQRAIYDSIIN